MPSAPVATEATPEGGPSREKGFEASQSSRALLEQNLAPQKWAVLIGVPSPADPTFTRLRFAGQDALELARILKNPRFGGFDRVITLTTPDRTSLESILFELRRLRHDLHRQDTFVLYFSGHGTLELERDGTPRLYLVASDTRASDLWGTGLELRALRDFLKELKPQRKVLVLDSCFAGTGKSRVSAVARERIGQASLPWGSIERSFGDSEAVLMASTLGGAAREEDALGHGTYTYYLLQALSTQLELADVNDDGAVTAYEAHDFARARTLERSGGAQVPEGFFRLLGRAELYLSGRPDPERARAASLVYSYGPEGSSGGTLSIDGRLKGTFPGAVFLEPGDHRITLRDAGGKVVADGRLALERGKRYPASMLAEELQGYRRYFGLEAGGSIQLAGPAAEVWGDGLSRVAFTSGYRVRGGAMHGLALGFGLGWSPSRSGIWREVSDETVRNLVDLSARLVWRRRAGPMQAGLGWEVGAVYLSPVGSRLPAGQLTPAQRGSIERWLALRTGPVAWQGWPVTRNLVVTLEERLIWFPGDFMAGGGATTNLQGTIVAGLELGF